MKISKRILSIIIAVMMIVSSLPFTVAQAADVTSDPSLVLKRPTGSVFVTDVTRVAFAQYSMKPPSGSNSVIVNATPSGIPQLNGSFSSVIAYAGETPTATQISFTPGVELASAPTVSCSNTTVTISDYTYLNGTYIWSVTGGTATVGTTLLFTVKYSHTDYNSVTGKSYTRNYETYGASYVDAIATPAGAYSIARTYEDFFFGQSTKNRSYVASYILGANTYGTLYNNGTGDGSVFFESTGSAPGWTTEYGVMHHAENQSPNRDFNIAYGADDNRPYSYVYFDRGIHSTLSDLNLRLVTTNVEEASNENERVTVSLRDKFVSYGVNRTYDSSSDDSSLTNDSFAAADIGLTGYSGSIKGAGASFQQYFTGSAPSEANGTYDYTITLKYQTAADWSEVFVGHSHSLRIIAYDKGALRTFVEQIQGTDPSVMTTDVPSGSFKGYNPQSWYYASGWEAFFNVYMSALSCLKRPDVTQEDIDKKYADLKAAYENLTMRTADYSVANAYYSQALSKDKSMYTLASWARVQNILDNYVTNYSAIYQPAIDKTTTDLIAALDSLEEAQADYTLFNTHLKTINNIMTRSLANYGIPASEAYNKWTDLEFVLRNSGCIYDELEGYVVAEPLLISEQATVNGYVLLLEKAINQLSLKSANYVEATKAENAYKVINLSQLEADCAASLTEKYNALVALKGKDLSYQSDIDAATLALNEALANLTYKPANISAALDMIATANRIDRSQYDDMSKVDAAVANLESKLDLDIRYQNDIDRATAALRSAIDSLNKNSANYTAVDEAFALVAQREQLIRDTYADTYGFTAETFYSNWSAVTDAMNNVVRGLDLTQQTTVDGYATAITNALNSLKENPADYTQTREASDAAYQIVTTGSGLYTEKSLDNLVAVYTAVDYSKPISEQATVDGYTASINKAIEELEYLPANYSQLNEQIEIANAKIAEDEAFTQAHPGYSYYTADSLSAVNIALAEVVEGLDIRYQSTVDGYTEDIKSAVAGLEYAPADYTQVELKLLEVPTDLTPYTTLSVATLNATINSINYTLTADKQATVDRYVTSIGNAISSLKYKAADYTAVNAAIKKVPADSSVYTEDSWNYLQSQIDAVVYNLDITHQQEVDGYALAIEQAIEFLRYKTADYTAVDEAVANANAEIEKGIYTDDSVAAVTEAIDAVKRDYPVTRQSEVNAFASAINTAVSKLVKKNADYTAVDEAITAANLEIEKGYYSQTSVEALESAINAVVRGYTVDRQAEVDAFAQAIVDATQKLEIVYADYTDVDDAIDYAKSEIETGLYTDESVALVLEAINAVDRSYPVTRQDEVDEFAYAIDDAVSMLKYKPADYTAVDEAITKAENEIAKGIYTETSVTNLRKAINAVVRGYKIDRQTTVDGFAQAINNAIDKLEKAGADYTAVTDAVNAANEKIATGYYTEGSVAELQAAIDAVEYGLPVDRQDEVQQYADNIVNLTNELELKLADYTELQKILDLLDNSASEIYTNTYKNFNEIMSLITAYRENTVSENMQLTIDLQAQVDEMTATLQGYIDMLEPEDTYTERFELTGGATVKELSGVKYIVGLQPSLTKTKFQNSYTIRENVTIEYNLSSTRYLGTGSTITVKSAKTGEVIEEYVIIIYGDVDGTATINDRDVLAIKNSLNGTTDTLQGAYKYAANTEGKRVAINDKDADRLEAVVNDLMVIDQTTGLAEEI